MGIRVLLSKIFLHTKMKYNYKNGEVTYKCCYNCKYYDKEKRECKVQETEVRENGGCDCFEM